MLVLVGIGALHDCFEALPGLGRDTGLLVIWTWTMGFWIMGCSGFGIFSPWVYGLLVWLIWSYASNVDFFGGSHFC